MTPAEYKAEAAKPSKPPKYRNKRIEVAGEVFDSLAEHKRWCELCILARSGEISDLRRQVTYKLQVNGELIASYIADHCYNQGGVEVVEDVKSPATRAEPAFRLKAKLMKATHGITIRIYP